MNERLRDLRKKYLNLSQRDFCGKIGMTQSTYASLETGKRELKDAYLKLICKSYNVSEEWLRNGKGDIFIKEPDRELDELLNIYDTLTPALQKYLLKQAKDLQALQTEQFK